MLKLRQISHIKQTKKDNCVAACLAMITGISIEEVEAELISAGGVAPYSSEIYIPFLVRHNILPERCHRLTGDILIDNSIYLMICASSVSPRAAHMIVGLMTHGEILVLDPNDDLENRNYYSTNDFRNGNIPIFEILSLTDCSL